MVTVADSNLFVDIMALIAVVGFGLSVVVAALAVVNRIRSDRQARRVEQVLAAWRARFQRDHAFRESLSVRHEDAFVVLAMWSSFRSGAMEAGQYSNVRLDFVARSAGFEKLAERLARSGDDADKIIGLRTLGLMNAKEGLPVVEAATAALRGDVSFEAYRALVSIDPAQIPRLFDALPNHLRWPAPRVEALIRALGPEQTSEPFARCMRNADAAQIARLARYVPLVDARIVRELIPTLIQRNTDPEVVAALLRSYRVAARPEDRAFLLPYLRHDASMVRLAALNALEPIAGAEDRPAILQALTDCNHWVRDRAAHVLVATEDARDPEPPSDRGIADAFARDAVTFALAEQKLRRSELTKTPALNPLRFAHDRVRADCSV